MIANQKCKLLESPGDNKNNSNEEWKTVTLSKRSHKMKHY